MGKPIGPASQNPVVPNWSLEFDWPIRAAARGTHLDLEHSCAAKRFGLIRAEHGLAGLKAAGNSGAGHAWGVTLWNWSVQFCAYWCKMVIRDWDCWMCRSDKQTAA